MAKKTKAEKEISFEDMLRQTEEVVEKLESGELSLEESMELYESGVNNLKKCNKQINDAQKKVKQLIESSGKLVVEDFEEEAGA